MAQTKQPTPAMLAFIEKIAKDLGVEAPPTPATFTEARKLIESGKAKRQAMWDAERAVKKVVEAKALEGVEPWVAGRYSVKGTVLSTKSQPSDFGSGDSIKMMLKDELGRKLWVSVPAALLNKVDTIEELKGASVSMVVTVKPKQGELHFAYGSRPAGAGLTKPLPSSCEGHESLAGEHMGETVHCDGSCKSVA